MTPKTNNSPWMKFVLFAPIFIVYGISYSLVIAEVKDVIIGISAPTGNISHDVGLMINDTPPFGPNNDIYLTGYVFSFDFQHPFTSFIHFSQEMARTKPLLFVSVHNSCESYMYLVSYTESIQLCHLALTPSACQPRRMVHTDLPQGTNISSDDSPLTLQSVGRSTSVSTILFTMVMKRGWLDIIILFERKASIYTADELVWSLSQSGVLVSVYEVTANNIQQTLMDTYRSPEKSFPYILLCELDLSRAILLQAREMNLRRMDYHWIVQADDITVSAIKPLLFFTDNIVLVLNNKQETVHHFIKEGFQNALETNRVKLGAIVDRGLLRNASWLSVREQITTSLKGEDFYGVGQESNYSEWDILSSIANNNNAPEFIHVGSWNSENKLHMQQDMFPNSFNGFNNKTFVVSTVEYAFFQKKVPQPDGTFKWIGLSFEVLDELANDLNFRYVVIEPPDQQWGIVDEHGHWNGMIRQVMDKEVDFAASVFSITADRQEVVDFCTPFFYEDSAVIIKRPADDNKVGLYLRPFKNEVWYMLSVVVVTASLTLWIVTRFSPHYTYINKKRKRKLFDCMFYPDNVSMYIFGAAVQQGGFWLPKAQSGRILVGCFWFFSIVVVATYTGNLIAFLAVQQIQLPFNTLNEMIKQNQIKWGTSVGVALVMLFRDATFEPYVSVNAGNNLVPSYSEGLRRVKEENFAFIAEKSWFNAKAATDCNLAMIKEMFYPTSYGMAFEKGWPFMKLFNEKITKMQETGLLDNWIKKWTPTNLNCTGLKSVTSAKSVTLADFQGALMVLCFGGLLAMTLLFTENIIKACHQRKMRSTSVNGGIFTVTNGLQNIV